MLYREKTLGEAGFGAKLAARLAMLFSRRRHADLDLLSMSRYLQRDIGIDEGSNCLRADFIWRK